MKSSAAVVGVASHFLCISLFLLLTLILHIVQHYGTLRYVYSHNFYIAILIFILILLILRLLLFNSKHFSVFQVPLPNQPSAIHIFKCHLLYSLQLILLY